MCMQADAVESGAVGAGMHELYAAEALMDKVC